MVKTRGLKTEGCHSTSGVRFIRQIHLSGNRQQTSPRPGVLRRSKHSVGILLREVGKLGIHF